MKNLLKQMCESKIESHNNYSIKKYKLRSIWQFYQAVNLCYSFLKINGINTLNRKQIKRRNKLYAQIVLNKRLSEKQQSMMDRFITEDMNIIKKAFELFDEIKETNKEALVDFEKDDYVAILASEIEEFLS